MADERKIDQDSDTLETLPPEELQKRIKKQKKEIKESFVLAITALIAIIAVCIAWFVNNTHVEITNINIAASNNINFELATVGNEKVVDTKKKQISDFLEKIGGLIGDSYSLGNENGTVTSAGNSSIQWNMSPNHQNFANVEGSGQIDGTGDENIGLQPGTDGELTFYIIPKIDGAQTVNCTLHLTPYVDDSKKSGLATTDTKSISFEQDRQTRRVWEITDQKVKNILNGHIYFFRDKQENLYTSWLQPDENGNLHFSVELQEKTKKDEAEKVTIYWTWPILVSQVFLKEGDQYLGGRSQLFDEKTQDTIINFMREDDSNNSSFFFISEKYEVVSVDKELIKKIHDISWRLSTEPFTRDEYSTISQPYNNADQFLGKTVSYVGLELNATN